MLGRELSCESRGGAAPKAGAAAEASRHAAVMARSRRAGTLRAATLQATRQVARLTRRHSNLRRALRTHMSPLLLALLLAIVPATAHAAAKPPTLIKTEQLDPRLQELTFTTPALESETHVRVLLPDGYDASGRTRYPVLYLLHGSVDDYKSWTDKGDAEAITKGVPLIVVMPDAGQFGNYTNWYNDGGYGPPRWENFHIRQLVPWIDAHYPTTAARRARAVAGLSMGGGGAMSYAARHPGLFVSASAFSGAVDTNSPGVQPLTQASGLSDGSQTPGAIFGLRSTNEVRWRAHNPWDLAGNLAG